jgi:membrane protein required for colicin V production
MNWADLSILVILLLSVLVSLLEGFVRELLSLLAWSISLEIAINFASQLAHLLTRWIPLIDTRLSIALIGLFIFTFFTIAWVNYLIIRSLGYTKLSWTGRLLGIPLGLAKGSIILIFLMLLAGLTRLPTMDWWQESLFIQDFKQIVQLLCRQLPVEVIQQFNFGAESNRSSLLTSPGEQGEF